MKRICASLVGSLLLLTALSACGANSRLILPDETEDQARARFDAMCSRAYVGMPYPELEKAWRSFGKPYRFPLLGAYEAYGSKLRAIMPGNDYAFVVDRVAFLDYGWQAIVATPSLYQGLGPHSVVLEFQCRNPFGKRGG